MIGWWNCDGLRFVEHYAINPAFRSSGYGSVLLSEWMNDEDIPVILEIEPVVDDLTQRRKNFYLRLGFKENDIKHFQPPYHKDTKAVELWIMSYPEKISMEVYRKFYQKQCNQITSVYR